MVIVVLNGFLGARRTRLDVTEIVDKAVADLKVRPEGVIRGRGGAGPVKFNKLAKRVGGLASQDRVLLLVGKSFGAHWIVKMLWDMAEREQLEKFKAVGALTVDPANALHKLQRKTKSIPTIDRIVNLHQYGFRSGYRIGPPATNLALAATHKGIETHARVDYEVRELLQWGCAYQRASQAF